ncbi:MAG: 2-octaprenyl-6-methoxyphenyl hydroxylase [Gammaproteobacteria bacterium]|nr:2-octaprenyl-6-methoxyphenyl hydroxylase [Gammaproteobacteria bacterium]
MTGSHTSYDIVIVGGGLVGMSLAVALANNPCSVLLLEQNQAAPLHANVLDLRTTGMTRSSEQMFIQAGIWREMASAATAIERLDISEQGNFGGARIDANQHGISPIGYMMPNHHLIKTLSDRVAQLKNVTVLSPASLVSAQENSAGYDLTVNFDSEQLSIATSLLVGADGGNSMVRSLLNIAAEHKDYEQSAIITNVRTQNQHHNIAYERFTQHGPLAVLPIQDGYCALIWTQAKANVDEYLQMNDEEFLQSLQKAFGYRLGKFLEVGKRSAYPLSLTTSNELTRPHAVLIGNAAQTVHPVAAQGFNLGLRDVHTLVHMLTEIGFKPEHFPVMLNEYEQKRMPDRDHVIKLTDGLTRLFAPQIWPAKVLRSIGVRIISSLPAVQRGVLRRNLGLRYFLGDTHMEDHG